MLRCRVAGPLLRLISHKKAQKAQSQKIQLKLKIPFVPFVPFCGYDNSRFI